MLSDKAIERAGGVFARAELGDPRLVRRAVGLAGAVARAPNQSLPKIWPTVSELEAGYRFLRNEQADFETLMEAVQQSTRERVLQESSVLALHDTSSVQCPAADAEEVGFLETGRAGFYLHHALCITEGRDVLGVIWAQLWGRAQRSQGRKRNTGGSELAKLAERESDRWLEGVTEAELWAQGCAQVIHVADREADSFRMFEHMRALDAAFVVRLRHDRRTDNDEVISQELAGAEVKLTRSVTVSARERKTMPRSTHNGREARTAKLVVRSVTLDIQPPRYMSECEPITLNAVQVLEENPPKGAEPISWVIATSLPVDTRAQLERVIDIYRARWVIEEFHKALKTGCMFEKRQLESFESITTLLALCYPVACELLRLRYRSRQQGIAAGDVLRKSLLDCLRAHPKARRLPLNPSAQDALAVIAGLGGHIKHNGPPGWQTLAAGYIELLAFERGWLAALASK